MPYMTKEQYEQLIKIDIRQIDPATVPDIREVQVNTDLPPEERIIDAVRQMNGNPFVYRCGDILVKSVFMGKEPLQSVLEGCLANSE